MVGLSGCCKRWAGYKQLRIGTKTFLGGGMDELYQDWGDPRCSMMAKTKRQMSKTIVMHWSSKMPSASGSACPQWQARSSTLVKMLAGSYLYSFGFRTCLMIPAVSGL